MWEPLKKFPLYMTAMLQGDGASASLLNFSFENMPFAD